MKILVGSPVSKNHAYCTTQYLKAIKNLSYFDYDILLIDNSDTEDFYNSIKEEVNIVRFGYDKQTIPERMVASRNYLRDYIVKYNYDYFLDIDQDVIPPKDIIQKLLSHKKDFITGIYYNNFEKTKGNMEKNATAYVWFTQEEEKEMLDDPEKIKSTNPNLYLALQNNNWDFSKLMRPVSEQEIAGGKLIKIRASGSGCMLVSKRALEAVPFRNNYKGGFDDVLFCFDLQEKGFELFADCSLICGHLTEKRPWDWKRIAHRTEIVYK